MTGKWAIGVSYDKDDRRQMRLSSLLGVGESNRWLRLESGKRWVATFYVDRCLIFDTYEEAKKVVDKYFKHGKDSSEFLWIRGCYLEVLELSVSDWNVILDTKLGDIIEFV